MRLRDLDPGCWVRIGTELAELCDEIAEDQHPEELYPDVAEIPPVPYDVWPHGSVAVEVWSLLSRASLLALTCAGDPRAEMADLRALVNVPPPRWRWRLRTAWRALRGERP